eukprot:s1217_g16.t1
MPVETVFWDFNHPIFHISAVISGGKDITVSTASTMSTTRMKTEAVLAQREVAQEIIQSSRPKPLALEEIVVDAADQVTTAGGTLIELAELFVQLSEKAPMRQTRQGEQGLRITFSARDLASRTEKTECNLLWVVCLEEMVEIVRLDARIPDGVTARPNVAAGEQKIAYWQVAWFWPASSDEMDASPARKHWQEQRPDGGKEI